MNIRDAIENRNGIDLTQCMPSGVIFKCVNDAPHLLLAKGNACRYFKCDRGDNVIAFNLTGDMAITNAEYAKFNENLGTGVVARNGNDVASRGPRGVQSDAVAA